MKYVNGYEKRLVATLDRKRVAETNSLFKPFKIAFAPRQLSQTERDREPAASNAMLLAQFCCVHGVAYFLRDTNMGCKHCGSYSKGIRPAL